MRKFLFLGLSLFSSFVFAAEQTRQMPAFSTIRAEGGFGLQVEVGPVQSVKVKGDDKFVSKITTEVFGDELRISYSEKNPYIFRMTPK